MRKSNRTKKSNRKTTTRKTTRKAGTSKTIAVMAKQFIAGMKSGKGFTTVINGISKKTKKNFNTVCQTLCKSGLCACTKINGTKIWWPNFTSKASKTTTNAAQAVWCQAMAEWCLATGCCTPRQLTNNSGNQKTFINFCNNCCTKSIGGTATATNAAWMSNWSKSNNRTWKSGKSFKFPTFASRTTGKRTRKAA